MRVTAPRGTTRDGKVFVDSGYMSETAVGEAGFRGMDERPETPADGEIVKHAILSQQRGASIQQFIENLNVGNSGMLGRQKYERDRLVTQTVAEMPRERRRLADAFVNNDPFDTFHDLIAFPCQPRSSELWRPSYDQIRKVFGFGDRQMPVARYRPFALFDPPVRP